MKPQSKGWRRWRFWFGVFPLLALPFPAVARQKAPLTQHRINELAAECANALIALSGLTVKQKPGETAAAHRTRVGGYLSALKKLDKELSLLRKPPNPAEKGPANLNRWRAIQADANRLQSETETAQSAWENLQKSGQNAQLGEKLQIATTMVQSILRTLRDARP